MKSILLQSIVFLLFTICGLTLGQWQVQTEAPNRVGPIYPENRSYQIQTTPPNYDPFQFNWSSGRWDYVPIPYDTPASGQRESVNNFNWNSGRWNYRPMNETPAPNRLESPQSTLPQTFTKPTGDSELWMNPTTRPAATEEPKSITITGRVIAIRAVTLAGEPRAQLLVRLRTSKGDTITADIGDRLVLPEMHFDFGSENAVTVTGKMGMVDGHSVLFAEHISVAAGAATQPSTRPSK